MVEIVLAFRHCVRMKKLISALIISLLVNCGYAQSIIVDKASSTTFSIKGITICVDPNDDELVKLAANLLQQDIEMVTGLKPLLTSTIPKSPCIIIGTISKSSLIHDI